ncbi:hypothetical protein GQ53DRAFT_752816 [Thozetella sp. PMI_491]|nr:hypothetical protein GQ53DRAFT_752816 [Thozetella sp. PMI_491]
MMYAWEENRERCYQLYVTEGKSMDEVMDLMRLRHAFTPSRRSYQTQFRKWNFPAKHSPAHKNEQLVSRVKELWGKNLSQKEMLRVLTEEDGFPVDLRDLQRLRARHRLLLRETGDSWTKRQSSGAGPSPSSPGDDDEDGGEDDFDEDVDVDPSLSGSMPSSAMHASGSASEGTPGLDQTASMAAEREQRRRDMEVESSEKLASRKRRRRTKGWAGFPADPPGPPRFPSETTLDQAKVILQLDGDKYKEMREKFKMICEEEGIVKKTLAGTDKWEAVKERLVMDSMHLRAVMYGNEKTELKKLAIDVIACDVTKRMRMADHALTIPEAKSILGLNPEQGREMRFAFYKILTDDQFMGKIMSGPEHWEILKQKWIEGSELLQGILAPGEADPNHEMKLKAFEVLARDVRKRYQEDSRAEKKAAPSKKPNTSRKRRPSVGPSTPDLMETIDTDYEVAQLSQLPMAPSTPNNMQRPPSTAPSSQRSRRAQRTPVAPAPAPQPAPAPLPEPRLLPAQVIDPTPDLSMDPSLGSSMLLGTDPGAAFLNQQFVQAYVPTQQAPIYHQPTAPYAVYLRMDPSSSFPAVTPMWIAMMQSRSLNELRGMAVAKYPGGVCLAISGIIKDDKSGGELPLAVNDDAELHAYLDHMEGRGAPTFNVQIRVIHDLNQGLGGGLGVQGQGWA